jgi:hypothetical protein
MVSLSNTIVTIEASLSSKFVVTDELINYIKKKIPGLITITQVHPGDSDEHYSRVFILTTEADLTSEGQIKEELKSALSVFFDSFELSPKRTLC